MASASSFARAAAGFTRATKRALMERETLEHLLGRIRTDVRLRRLCGAEQHEEFFESWLIERRTSEFESEDAKNEELAMDSAIGCAWPSE